MLVLNNNKKPFSFFVNRVKKDYRRFRIGLLLRALKPFFLSGDNNSTDLLKAYGYHLSLQMHPSVLFLSGSANIKHNKSEYKIKKNLLSLKKLIEEAPFYDSKDRKMLTNLGVSSFFVNDISRMLATYGAPFVQYSFPRRDLQNENIVVYTVIAGDYDSVHEILYKQPNVDYLLFTNNKRITSTTWKVQYVESDMDNVLLSREIKILPDKYLRGRYTASIYVDANVYLYGDIGNMVCVLDNNITFAVTRHATTESVKKEFEACVLTKGVAASEAEEQYERYLKEGFKDNMGLAECGILVRRCGDKELNKLMNEWFEEFRIGIPRDQVSLFPCIQRQKFKQFRILEGSVWHNQFCIIGGHKIKKTN